jgi:uncharacterized membrane protein YccC
VTVAPTSLRGLHRTRIVATVAAAVGMGIAASIATAAGQSAFGIVAVTAAAAYLYGILSSFGEAASGVGLNVLIATIVLGNITIPPSQRLEIALCVLGGGLLQALLVAVFWPLAGRSSERGALAAAYRTLADYARHVDDTDVAIPPHEQLETVRAALADPQPFGRKIDLLALQTLADEAERMRATLSLIAATRAERDTTLPADTGEILDAIADAVERDVQPRNTDAWQRATENIANSSTWQRLYGQLRAAWRSAALGEPAPGTTVPTDPLLNPHVERWWPSVREAMPLHSPFGRHAVRLAIVLAIAIAAYRLGHVPRGYWIALTAAIVLRPDFTTTYAFGAGRIAGTIVGGLAAWGIATVIPPTPMAHASAALAFAALAFVFQRVGPAFFAAAITGFVVFVLAIVGLHEGGAVVERIAATLAGGALALLAFSAWPTWEATFTRSTLADLLDAIRRYSVSVFAVLAGDAPLNMDDLERQQHDAWALRTQVSTSIERMLNEQFRTTAMKPQQALTILTSTRRLGLGNLALTAMLQPNEWKPVPAIRPFAHAVDAALRTSIDGLRNEHARAAEAPDLRKAYTALERALMPANEEYLRGVLAQCDLMVDSINTILETLAG